MGVKKILVLIIVPLFMTSFLSSQSLVELAKKEKERRAKLKAKSAKIITNADLTKLKKKPAVTATGPFLMKPKSQPAAISPERTTSSSASTSPDKKEAGKEMTLLEAQQKWQKAKEYVDLLTLKINGLWQKFYSFRDWTLRDSIQREMNDTLLKLQKAKADEAKAKQELDRIRLRKRK